MQTLFYILASIAAVLVIITIPIMAMRAWVLMTRMEDTRRNLANLINESALSLQHANKLLARTQEGVDHLRHTIERIERILALLQPATAVGSLIAGAKRAISGRHPSSTTSEISKQGGESS